MVKHCSRVLALLLLLTAPLAAQSVETDIERVRETLVRNFQRSKLLIALTELEWRPGLHAGVARLAAGETISQSLWLEAGREYAFIGSGGPEVTDLDVYLRRAGGAALTSDQEPDPSPVVSFVPPKTGAYVLQLHLVGSTEPEALVSFNALATAGTDLVEEDFRNVLRQFGFSHRALHDLEPDLRLTDAPGQWLLYGLLVDEANPVVMHDLRPGGPTCYVATAGSEQFSAIDLYMGDPDGSIVSGDTADDALPLLIFDPQPATPYRLRAEGRGSDGPALLLLGFYQK